MGKVEDRRARVTDAIVAAATQVMTEGGAAALSLHEVARRVGMRTPSLYGYFASRAALCDEIFRRGWSAYGALTAGVTITSDSDFLAEVSRGLLDSATWAVQNRAMAELMFWRPIHNWEPSPEAFAPAVAAMGGVARILGEARTAGLVREDADLDEMAQAMAVLAAGIISQQLSNEPGVPAESGRASRYCDTFAAMFVHQFGTPEALRRRP